MKAIRLTKLRTPLEEMELDLPRVGPSDLLVRVKGAGICHSDAHYRAGISPGISLPVTPGHEVAGIIEEVGKDVRRFRLGDRVCVHYLVTCGTCRFCQAGIEQFCPEVQMIGKQRDGGYAEFIVVPEQSLLGLPEQIPFEQGAILMCSSATSLHALNKARFRPGETIAVFGCGGLGVSAVQLARHFGAAEVFAVDVNSRKLELAKRFGATAIDGSKVDPVMEIMEMTHGRGVDVALELVGLPVTMRQAVQSLAIQGRAALVGLMQGTFQIAPYQELLNKEAEIIGVSDHLASEIPRLLDVVLAGALVHTEGVIRSVPLEAGAVNAVLDGLEGCANDLRAVITP